MWLELYCGPRHDVPARWTRHTASQRGMCDLEAELLDMVCYDIAIEPTFQPLASEELNRRANTAPLSWIPGETTGRLFLYTGMSPECKLVQRA